MGALPALRVRRIKPRVGIRHRKIDLGDDHPIGTRSGELVDLRSARHKKLGFVSAALYRCVERLDPFAARVGPERILGEHQIAPSRQGLANGIKGLSTHENGMPERRGLEMLKVFGQAPGKRILTPDRARLGTRDNQGDARLSHTATGALIRGCAWYPRNSKSSNV